MESLRRLIRTVLGPDISRRVGDRVAPLLARVALFRGAVWNTWSQYGEDLVIDRLLGNKRHGTYIDIGANDPNLINNTLLLVEMMHDSNHIEAMLAEVGYDIVWRNSTNAIFRQIAGWKAGSESVAKSTGRP